MAATVTNVGDMVNMSWGPEPVSVVTITPDTSYPPGGYTINPNDCGGLKSIEGMEAIGYNTAAIGYVIQWNTTTGKMVILNGALAESSGDLSTLAFTVIVYGQR